MGRAVRKTGAFFLLQQGESLFKLDDQLIVSIGVILLESSC